MSASTASSETARPCVGFIVPPAAGEVPPEATAMYGDSVDFVAVGLALERLTPDGYDAVQDRLVDAAYRLRDMGAQAIALMGTSLSFYKGPAYNDHLTALLQQSARLPAVTMSTAVVSGLRQVGARRIAVATAYGAAVNERLVHFLHAHDVEVLALESLAIEDVSRVHDVTQDDLAAVVRKSMAAAPDAQGVLISCGGLRTLELTQALQAEAGMPVISSSTAGPWAAVRLLGLPSDVPGAPRRLDMA